MCYVVGYRPETRSERGRFNAALMEIRETGASPEDIVLRARAYRRKWPQLDLTATALAAHWGELGPRQTPVSAWQPLPGPSSETRALPSSSSSSDPEATERARREFLKVLEKVGSRVGRAPD